MTAMQSFSSLGVPLFLFLPLIFFDNDVMARNRLPHWLLVLIWGEPTDLRWIPLTKGQWYYCWIQSQVNVPLIWNAMTFTSRHSRDNAHHYSDVIIRAMSSQITGVSIVCITVCSGADQRKCQSPASLAFVRGIHRWPLDSPRKRGSDA